MVVGKVSHSRHQKKTLLASLLAAFFLFLVSFDLQIPLLPNGVGFSFFVFFFLFPFVFFKKTLPTRGLMPFFLLFLFVFFSILLRVFFNNGVGLEFVLSWAKAFFVYLSCFLVYFVFFRKEKNSYFFALLVSVYLFNAFWSFVSGTFPDKFVFFEVFKGEAISDSLGDSPYRNSFLSGSGYFSIGSGYGLMLLTLSYGILKYQKNSIYYYFCFIFLSIAAVFAARTAFFAIIISYFYFFAKRSFGFLLFSFLFGFSLSFLLKDLNFDFYWNWFLAFFLFFENASALHLMKDMVYWPGEQVFFLGNGFVNDGSFPYTDVGYMKDILFGGLGFLFLKLSFLLVFAFSLFKKEPLFVSFLVALVLVFHLKGAFIYNNAQGMAPFYFCYFLLLRDKR